MKKVVSVSLGSSSRNHKAETEILGEKFIIERIGTDGDRKKAIEIIKELDGKVDAFGMGGIDLYLFSRNKKYLLSSALPIKKAAQKTPIVDGSGLKNTLERMVIDYLTQEKIIDFKNKSIMITSALDRFGMAESLESTGAEIFYGDVFYALGIPYFLKSLDDLDKVAKVLLPVVRHLPFELLYPTGNKQDKENKPHKVKKIFEQVDILAGDFLYIQKNLPQNLDNKIIITNTTTEKNLKQLKALGAKMLITTTPEYQGRSFGTNVMEGVLISLANKPWEELTPRDYREILKQMNFTPRIVWLNEEDKRVQSV